MLKKDARMRRARKTRERIKMQTIPRLTVHRSLQHMYAQIVVRKDNQSKVLACASTLDATFREKKQGNKKDRAKQVGLMLALKAKEIGVTRVAFDRSGFAYHGRVQALAEAAREGGLGF